MFYMINHVEYIKAVYKRQIPRDENKNDRDIGINAFLNTVSPVNTRWNNAHAKHTRANPSPHESPINKVIIKDIT